MSKNTNTQTHTHLLLGAREAPRLRAERVRRRLEGPLAVGVGDEGRDERLGRRRRPLEHKLHVGRVLDCGGVARARRGPCG